MKVSKSALFIFELIVVILLFTVSAAICTTVFAKGYVFSTDSTDKTMAVLKAESAAETIKAENGNLDKVCENLDGDQSTSVIEDDTLEIYYDTEWKSVPKKDATYTVSVITDDDDGMLNGDIDIIKEDESLYKLSVKKYTGD